MNNILNILTIFTHLMAIILGLFVGGYVLLWGGMVTIATAITSESVNSWTIVWGLFKIIMSPTMGFLFYAVGHFFADILDNVNDELSK